MIIWAHRLSIDLAELATGCFRGDVQALASGRRLWVFVPPAFEEAIKLKEMQV